MKYKVALIGFGTVGQGVIEILDEKREWFKSKYGFECEVVAISDPIKGSVYNERGVKLKEILRLVRETGKIGPYELDSIETITATNSNVIVEVTPTDIKTGEPGITHIKTALINKKHVITTNKGPVVLAYNELNRLAKENGVFFMFEGTVMAGTPVLSLGLEALAGIRINEIRGILNGTTNYILTKMEEGNSYAEALADAQRLGYAEANPAADVEGWDAVAKVLILGNVVMGGNLKINDVERVGITGISSREIEEAKATNKRYKLIGKVWIEGNKIRASVKPEKLSKADFLSQVSGVKNALTFVTDELSEVTIIGPGAGRRETGFAVVSDLIRIQNYTQCK